MNSCLKCREANYFTSMVNITIAKENVGHSQNVQLTLIFHSHRHKNQSSNRLQKQVN